MASMTRSQLLRSSRCVEPRSRLTVSSLVRASIFALATRLSRLFWIPPRPLSRRAWFASITMVEKPACADTWAMPEPMSPQPITPTCLMAMLERPPWTIYRWWRDVTAGLRGRDASEASTPLLVSDQGLDAVTLQALPPLQEGQLDEEVAGDHNPSEPLDQAERGGHGAAGREQVVHDEHALAAADGVLVDGEHVTAVFELVLLLDHRARELALLPHGHETRAELLRQRAAEDEAARLHADHDVDLGRAIALGQMIDHRAPRHPILEQRGDVLEEDPFGREVFDIADLCYEGVDVHAGDGCYPLVSIDAIPKALPLSRGAAPPGDAGPSRPDRREEPAAVRPRPGARRASPPLALP